MSPVNYFLALLISFLGIYVGFLLAHLTKEEFKDIHNYLILMRFALVLLVAVTLFFAIGMSVWAAIFLLIIVALTFYFVKVPDQVLYPMLAIAFYASSTSQIALFICSLLIFCIGLPVGTFIYQGEPRKFRLIALSSILLNYGLYLVLGVILFLLNGSPSALF